MIEKLDDDFIFSVVIPVYNTASFLRACVGSVQNQTDANLEIILVDDGSTDSSGKICDDLAREDNRIQVFHQENQGAAIARNFGLSVAKGEYLIFLDSDDYWKNKYVLAEIRQLIIESKKPEVVLTGYERYNLKTGESRNYALKNLDFKDLDDLKIQLLKKRMFYNSPCTKVIRRDFLLENKIVFPNFKSEDLIWCRKVLTSVKEIAIYSGPLIVYQIARKGSSTSTLNDKHCRDIFQQFMVEKESLEELPPNSEQIGKAYWAEQLCWFMAYLPLLNNGDLNKTIYEIESAFGLLPYGLSKRTKIVNLAFKFFGPICTIRLLNIYLKIKRGS